MYKKRNHRRVAVIVAALGIWALLLGVAVGADKSPQMKVIQAGAKLVAIDDVIMMADLDKGSIMTLKETIVFTGSFKKRGNVHATRFLDYKGKKVDFKSLRPNQRIKINGYKLSFTEVFAESVQILGTKAE